MPPMIMAAYFCFSALVSLKVFSIGEYAAGQLMVPGDAGMVIILYCAFFPSVLLQTFFMRGVELIGANRAKLYVNLVPVFAAFMAIGRLSERMDDYHVAALIVVLAGIVMAEKHKV